MKRFAAIVVALALVGVVSATPITTYSRDYTDTTGVTVRPNDPNNPTTGPYLEDGGVWAHVPLDSTGYQIMDVQMYDLQAPTVLDCTYGQFTITLQVEGDWMIDGEVQGIWIRLYSRAYDSGSGQWAFSGGRNFYVEVPETSQLLGFGPGWVSFTVNTDDWNENNWIGPFDPTQVYKFRLDCINWAPDTTPYRFGISHFDWVAPECPADLDGDDDVDLGDLATLLANYGCAPQPANNVWNVGGFEGYTLGALPGQFGWAEDTSDPNNIYGTVNVIDDPTGGGHGKVIQLTAESDGTGGWLGAGRDGVDVTGNVIVLEWDQYRTGTQDNFWYADDIAWDGWWAMQWDSNGQASAQVYDFGVPVTPNVWQHVMYVYDTVNDTVTVVVDGQSYTSPNPMTDNMINGADFEFESTLAGGFGESVYVDNVQIGTAPDIQWIFGCTAAQGDYNGDHNIDLSDLAVLLSSYGCGTP